MHQWYYVKAGIVGDEQIGPIAEGEFLQIVQAGTIGRKALVSSPTRTNGNWLSVEQFPKLLQIWESGKQQRDAAKQQQLAAKQAESSARRAEQQQHAATQQAAVDARRQQLAQISDCGNAATLERILAAVQGILTNGEQVRYIAVQEKPIVVTPDAIVATDRRLIFFVPKLLGRFDFHDYLWRDLGDAHLSQNMIGSTFTARHISGKLLSMDYLPKQAAQRLYRLCQEAEEQAVETRRQREMEERRAGAMQIQVNSPQPQAAQPQPATNDLVSRLATLKQMLDAGLIPQAEFDERKAAILAQV